MVDLNVKGLLRRPPPRPRRLRRLPGRREHRALLPQPARVVAELKGRVGQIERLEAAGIADTIAYLVTRPRHVAIDEILVRPTEQRD